jgi:hypothetical protein
MRRMAALILASGELTDLSDKSDESDESDKAA